MKTRNLFTLLAMLLMCSLFLGINSCSSVSDDVLGAGQTAGSDDEGMDEGDDEDDDEGDDEGGDCPGVDDDEEMIDSVEVMPGDTCTLDGRIVVNSITVGRGATLIVHGTSIGGDIFSDTGAAAIMVDEGSALRGSIILALVTGETVVQSTTVAGDINIKKNTGQIALDDNDVYGDVQLFENTGGAFVTNNRITNILDCVDNDPFPRGQGNAAAGMEGQCQGF
jgi:hypothetical protein